MRLFTLALLLLIAGHASSQTITVTNNNDSGAGSLRQAVLDATPGTTINFSAALIGQTITFTDDIDININLTIDGLGADPLTLDGNNATRHFTILGGAVVTISNMTLMNGNSSTGGSINLANGNLTLINSMLITNNSTGNGGAIDNNAASTLTLMNTTISNNTTTTFGGAINNPGNLTIRNSTLSDNFSGGDGGAITNLGGVLDIANSTVINNTASNCGGGIGNIGTIPNIQNTIVAGNDGGVGEEFCSLVGPGAITSAGGNFIGQEESTPSGNTMGAFDQPNDQVGPEGNPIDPLLGPLADNGGPTMTHLPLIGSPVIDSGLNANLPATDQRGLTRLVNGNVDTGAVELQTDEGGGDEDIVFANGFESL